MYSDELQFLKFLNNLIQMQNKKYYNNVSIVSASNRGDPSTALISSDKKMINFEDLVLDHYGDIIRQQLLMDYILILIIRMNYVYFL